LLGYLGGRGTRESSCKNEIEEATLDCTCVWWEALFSGVDRGLAGKNRGKELKKIGALGEIVGE